MATVDQSKVRSGFDVEALLGERYLQMLLGTALDAGMIPAEATFSSRTIFLGLIPQEFRLYEPTLDSDGATRPTHPDAFKTEILFGHALGANAKVRGMIGLKGGLTAIDLDLFVKVDLINTLDEEDGGVAVDIHVVDVDSTQLAFILSQAMLTKDELLAKIKEAVDRQIDIGGVSKFKRIEALEIKWHEPVDNHPACLGIYINIRMRNGDPEEDFLPRRGDTVQARNFLPEGEEMAMASRPGMYADMALDVFSETAVPNGFGGFEHAFRKSLLHPNSQRLGDLHSVHVGQIPPQAMGGGIPVPQNGLRITVEGDIRDPIDLTNTDLTYTIDLRPKLADDGSLEWDTRFNADVDAVFEFTTIWAVALLGILLGPYGALIALGVVFVAELGVGIGITLYKEGSVQDQANAKLADVIPDRLTIKTRRWDPFYATLHQVVTKPSQAEFNDKGFMMCGKAFIGRQLVPPVNTIIRDELRDSSGVLSGMRYQIDDFETVLVDAVLDAPGVSRRSFELPDPNEQNLWGLSLEAFEERKDDPEGPLVLTKIPYFEGAVYIRDHQIDGVLCISGFEIETIQNEIREQIREQGREGIRAHQGAQIRADVINDLGPGATQEEIDTEVDKRIEDKLKAAMDKYQSPEPLRMALNGDLQPFLRFDVSPEELVLLQKKEVILLDSAVRAIRGRRVSDYIRDRPDPEPGGDEDNLLNRPKYKPTEAGPVFR